MTTAEIQEMHDLEAHLAYENASSFLDCNCPPRTDDVTDWLETSADAFGEGEHPEIAESVRYLELRGLIERHPEHSTWVQVLDEDAVEILVKA